MARRRVVKNPEEIREFTLILRAVVTTVRATEMLYVAADLLGESDIADLMVCLFVARMLDLPEADPEVVKRVLLNLP